MTEMTLLRSRTEDQAAQTDLLTGQPASLEDQGGRVPGRGIPIVEAFQEHVIGQQQVASSEREHGLLAHVGVRVIQVGDRRHGGTVDRQRAQAGDRRDEGVGIAMAQCPHNRRIEGIFQSARPFSSAGVSDRPGSQTQILAISVRAAARTS